MKKGLLITIVEIIILIALTWATIVIASADDMNIEFTDEKVFEDNGGTIGEHKNLFQQNVNGKNKVLTFTYIAREMGNPKSTIKQQFLNEPAKNLLVGGLFYPWRMSDNSDGYFEKGYNGESPIHYKSTACFVHTALNEDEGYSTYYITSVIDFIFDQTLGRIVAKCESKGYGTSYSYNAGNLGYALYLNETKGFDGKETGAEEGFNQYKTYVNKYAYSIMKKDTDSDGIVVSNKFSQRSQVDKDILNNAGVKTEEINKYANNVNSFQELKKEEIKNGNGSIMNPSEYKSYNISKNGISYTMIGPFKMNFEPGIEKITVNGTAIDNINNEDILYASNLDNYSDATKWDTDWKSKITSGRYFYLAVKKSLLPTTSNNYNVEFKQIGVGYYKSRLILLESGQQQQMGMMGSETEMSYAYGTASYTIEHKANGSITIRKAVQNQPTKKVGGVKLKVYGEKSSNSGSGWVKIDGTLTQNYSDGALFTTTNNGEVKVGNLEPGTYYIYEIGVPSGFQLEEQRCLYPDSNDPKKFAGKSEYGKCVYLTKAETNGNDVQTEWYGQNPNCSITIQKAVEKRADLKVSGAKFKVYGERNTDKSSGWVKTDGSVTPNYKDGAIFTTDDNGEAKVENLGCGTYYIYEIDVPSGFQLEDQRILYPDSNDPNKFAGKSEYGKCVYLTKVIPMEKTTNINKETGWYGQKTETSRTLTLGKKDFDTNTGINGAGFKILQKLSRDYKQGNTQFNKNDYVWFKKDGSITKDVREAYEFVTDYYGNIKIKNIRTYGTCYVYETKTVGDYTLFEQQNGKYEFESNKQYMGGKPSDYSGKFLTEWVYTGTIEIKEDTGTTIGKNITNEHSLATLVLEKKDWTYKDDLGVEDDVYLPNATFKLYGTTRHGNKSGWVKKVTINGKSKYTVDPEYKNAEEFTTNSNGIITINNLEIGDYYIYEINGPEGYDMKAHERYHQPNSGSEDLKGEGDWIFMGYTEHIYQGNNKSTLYEMWNKKYTKITGKVWLDEPDTKGNITNNLYEINTNDKLLANIKVNLWNRKTNEIIATTYTGNNGEYEFEKKNDDNKITYWEAAYCYVEFIYDNTKYITVAPFQGGDKQKANNSKAQESDISGDKLYDNKLTGVGSAKTYISTENKLNQTSIERLSKNGMNERILCGYYNDKTYTIENINLGLIEKFTPDHTIGEELEYVKIKKGNYTFKYKYGDEAVTEQGSQQSSVMLQNSKKTFTQSLYPSDVKYNIANGLNSSSNEGFKIYVVYKITVKNNTAENVEPIYVEKTLNLTSLTNTYDTSRYELANEAIDDNENINSDFRNWSDSSGIATYNLRDTSKKFKDGITSGDQESVYIEFKVKDEALTKLLTDNQLAGSPTKAKSTGYHIYERKDNSWNASKINTHISIPETKENSSLYLAWKLYGTRTISGTVFEDTKIASRENERIGDGKFDQRTEKTLTDVIVSLMNAENTTYNGSKDQEAYLYEDDLIQNPATGKWTRCKQKAVTKVDANGNYSFKGVIPGKYYLKFTYGDGRTSITDLNGNAMNVATKIKGQSATINSNYYKSTILTGAAQNEGNSKWFLTGISEGVNSVATDSKITYYDENGNLKAASSDIINARTTSNKEINNTSSKTKAVIDAISPTMDIAFEYLSNIEYQVTNNQLLDLKTNCTGMCFGIIERPHTEITLNKEIKNVKLTLSNGTSLINGNPMNANVSPYLTGITASDSKVETDYTNLYGSTLTIDYSVKVTNESELDYATKEYYTKGTIGRAAPVTTTVTKIIDYVSYKAASYQETSDNLHFANEYTNSEGYTKADYYENNIIETNEREYKNQLLITNVENLTPKKAGRGTYESNYVVSVSKLLPSSETTEDLGMKSYSEIIGITNITFTPQYTNHMGSYIAGDSTSRRDGGTSEADNAGSTITLTPPTGENKDYTVYIVAATMLGVIGIGILIIKKVVL